MKTASAWAIRHPVVVFIITVGVALFGGLALFSMNREFAPPISINMAVVATLWPGADAENVERDVTSVLESSLASVPGVTDITSESREGVSIVQLRFRDNVSHSEILQLTRIKIDNLLEDLPDNILGKPKVSIAGSNDLPTLTFSVSDALTEDELSRYVEKTVLPEIYRVKGVAEATVLGDSRSNLIIRLKTDSLSAANVSPREVLGAIKNQNSSLPSGLVPWKGQEWSFNVTGEFSRLEDVENLVVGNSGSTPIRLSDVADISFGYRPPKERVRSAKKNLVMVQIAKKEDGNAIKISRDVRSRLDKLQKKSSSGVRFSIVHDDSFIITSSLTSVFTSALIGVAMAIAVVWFFLKSLRYTLIIAVSLPVSLLIAFAGMYMAGQTINVLTLAGLTVSLGLVVDSSIVVIESIHRRHFRDVSSRMAALDGSQRVAGSVLASTTTSISVFAPMIFLTGIIGSIMKNLSLTLVFTLGASLFAAILIVPALARREQKNPPEENPDIPDSKKKSGLMHRIEQFYRKSLSRSLGMSRIVLFTAVSMLIITGVAVDMTGVSFLPPADYSEIFISMELPPGSSLEESVKAADKADDLIREKVPELKTLVFYVGMEDELQKDVRKKESVWGQLLLRNPGRGRRNFQIIINQLNEELPKILPGVSIVIQNGGFDRNLAMGTDGFGYRVELSSENWADLQEGGRRIETSLRNDPLIVNTRRNIAVSSRKITARINPDTVGLSGVSAASAETVSRIAFNGVEAGLYQPDGAPERDIWLTSDLERITPGSENLAKLPVRSRSGTLTMLDTIAKIQDETGLSGIRRRNQVRTLTVIGYPTKQDIRKIGSRLKKGIKSNPLPEGVEWKVQGVSGLATDSMGALGIVLAISLFLVYAVMAIQFERLVQALIVMAAVPFCFIGVVGGLAIFGSSISLISFLGIVTLGGIVVNNAIIQIESINQLREEGMELQKAIVEGAASRIKPILMTTLTTFCGVIPLALAWGSGSQLYAPLGQAIAGGLLSSTLVTLYLVPSLYRLVERKKEQRMAKKQPAAQVLETAIIGTSASPD